MRSTEFISEVFNSDIRGKIIKSTSRGFAMSADIGDRQINFHAAIYDSDSDSNSNTWEIDFMEKNKKGHTFSKTGSGNELQVFSFIIECIKDFVFRYHPEAIIFNSEKSDNNRSKLYKKLLLRTSKLIPGYSFNCDTGINSTPCYDNFVIKKDK